MSTESNRSRYMFDEQAAENMTKTAWHGSQSFIHPRLAKQIVRDFGITNGKCLDIGCGPARLTIELARLTDLEFYGLEKSPHMVEIAKRKVEEHGLQSRVTIVEGFVEEMPFEHNFFDLIVSRGAMGFFDNKVKAMRNIYNVLKEGGHTFIGGGDARGWPLNPVDIVKKIVFHAGVKKRFKNPEWQKMWLTPQKWGDILQQAGIPDYTIHEGKMWIEMRK